MKYFASTRYLRSALLLGAMTVSALFGAPLRAEIPNRITNHPLLVDDGETLRASEPLVFAMPAGPTCVRWHETPWEQCRGAFLPLPLLLPLRALLLLDEIGYETSGPIDAYTDNKGAYDLCHRFSSAQNSKHIDRKVFKMRELRGAQMVNVNLVVGESNPADLFTKIVSKQLFEKFRKFVLGLVARSAQET